MNRYNHYTFKAKRKDNTLDAWNNGLCENVREKAKNNIKKAINSEKIKVNQYNKNNDDGDDDERR